MVLKKITSCDRIKHVIYPKIRFFNHLNKNKYIQDPLPLFT